MPLIRCSPPSPHLSCGILHTDSIWSQPQVRLSSYNVLNDNNTSLNNKKKFHPPITTTIFISNKFHQLTTTNNNRFHHHQEVIYNLFTSLFSFNFRTDVIIYCNGITNCIISILNSATTAKYALCLHTVL